MFGYIKPLMPELKVKDSELYRAYYCGLCRSLKGYGLAGRAALTYDAAFAALLLTAVCGEGEPTFTKHGCVLHPVRGKTPFADGTDVLDYCAALCVMLAKYKLKDDSRDGRPLRACLLPAFAAGCRKAARKYPQMEKLLAEGMEKLAVIERENAADPDAAPLLFGGVLAELICGCPAVNDECRPVLWELSRAIGGYVYTIDAWDDRKDDRRRGCYNVFNTAEANGLSPWPDGRYRELGIELGSEGGKAEVPAGESPAMTGTELHDMASAMLDMYINSACLAYDLLEVRHNGELLDNIIRLGLGAAADEVLNKSDTEDNNK